MKYVSFFIVYRTRKKNFSAIYNLVINLTWNHPYVFLSIYLIFSHLICFCWPISRLVLIYWPGRIIYNWEFVVPRASFNLIYCRYPILPTNVSMKWHMIINKFFTSVWMMCNLHINRIGLILVLLLKWLRRHVRGSFSNYLKRDRKTNYFINIFFYLF